MAGANPVIKLEFSRRPAHRETMNDRTAGEAAEWPAGSEDREFSRIYREHHAELLAFVRRRVAAEAEAADIVQESFLGLLRYCRRNHQVNLRALMFKIALNRIGMRLRSARAHHLTDHVPLEEEALALMADDPSQDRRIAAEQRLDRLVAIIEKLPRKCRQAFVLRCFHDMSLREIAARMNVSTKAVEKHITTAMALLQKKKGVINHDY